MDKKLIGLVLIFLLVFTLFMGALIFEQPIRIRARNDRVASKCYLFADPVFRSVPANGKSAVKVNVSVSDTDLNIVPNKSVTVSASSGVLDKQTTTTGDSGIASFSLISATPTTSILKASVGSLQCEPQGGVSVKFE